MEEARTVPTFQRWLIAQSHRDDVIGLLARQWVVSSPGADRLDFETWIERRRTGLILKGCVESAENEYSKAKTDLELGKKTATFPSWYNHPERKIRDERSHSFHRANPQITTGEYLETLHLQLRKKLEAQHIIYIDTCHWIKMRHWYLDNARKEAVYGLILAKLRQLREKGVVVCPISFPLFVELMRQSDDSTRTATAQLMDEFSDGICVQFPREITKIEIRQQIARSMFRSRASDYLEWIWTKTGWITGERLPYNEAFNQKENEYIQKVVLDHMWETKLEDLIEVIDQAQFPHMDGKVVASAYNVDAKFYHEKNMTFEEILAHEKAHLFHLNVKEEFPEIAKEFYTRYPEEADRMAKQDDSPQKPDPFVLASMQIMAGINAIFIASGENFGSNDLPDSEHASLALPYCDIFLCDGPLAHKLKVKPLCLDKAYKTHVVSIPSDFLSALSKI